jgi:hypothetical protein
MPERRQRAQKPSLKRDKPIRSWSKAFGGTSAGKTARAPNTRVSDGVRLGYQVIDDYLTKGQEAARTLGGAGGETLKAASTEVQRLTQRMFQYASDLASAWMELVQTMTATGLANQDAGDKADRPRAAARDKQAASAPARAEVSDPADQPCAVSLEIDSPLPTETTIELRRRAIEQPIEVQALVSDDPKAPRLTGISIKPLPKTGRVLVRLRVPPKQPVGLYRGLIIDRATNLPCGTVAVRIGTVGAPSA